jgi:putative hydrolase of the HAD superfamily
MIEAVLFDLDGTLYDRDLLVQTLIGEQFDAFCNELGNIDRSSFIRRVLQLDAHGFGDKVELYRSVEAEWVLSRELSDRLHSDFWSRYIRHCKVSEDTRATLEQLRRHKIKLGVITNGTTQWQQQKLDSLGITPLFDTVLISEAEGLRKPNRAIFERALERLSVRAGDAMFVGDNPEADVAGSRTAGLIPVWKYVPYWKMNLKDVLTVHKLGEILPHCLEGT